MNNLGWDTFISYNRGLRAEIPVPGKLERLSATSSASIETLLDPAVSFSRLELQPDKNVSPGRFEPDWNEAKN